MRHIAIKFVVLVMFIGIAGYSTGMPAPEQDKAAMTVAQLEARADLLRAQKNYPEAIDYLNAALRKDSKNPVLYNKLGLAELKNSDWRAARTHFERAVKFNKKYADALNNIGAVDYTQKNFGSAAKYFKKALALDETRATFHVNLGAAWFAQNKVDRAIAEYSRALELDPLILEQNAKAGVTAQIASPEERARYSYMLAKIYARYGYVDRCLECLKKAKEEGYRDMGNVYQDPEFAGLRKDARLAEVVPPPER